MRSSSDPFCGRHPNAYGQAGGTAFELAAGSHTITTLFTFDAAQGRQPVGGLIVDAQGDLYGATQGGGIVAGDFSAGMGTIFELSPVSPVFAAPPTAATAGVAQSFTVQLQDATGTPDTTDTADITLALTSGPAGVTVGGPTTVTTAGGIATFAGLTLNTAGTYTVTATAPGMAAATATLTVVPAAAAGLTVTAAPATATAGQPIGPVTVTVVDAYGNVVTADTSSVSLAGTGLAGTTTVAAVGGVGTFGDLSLASAGSVTLTATDGALAPATSAPVTVSPAAVATLVAGKASAPLVVDVSAAFPTPAGAAGQAPQKLQVQVVSSAAAGGAVLVTKSVKVKGGRVTVGKLNVHAAGDYTVVVSGGAGNSVTQTITVVPGPAVKLTFTSVPPTLNGQAAVTVQAVDKWGNVTTLADGLPAMVKLARGGTFGRVAALVGTTAATVANGTATFPDLTVTSATATAGRGRLTVTLGKLSATSTPFATV